MCLSGTLCGLVGLTLFFPTSHSTDGLPLKPTNFLLPLLPVFSSSDSLISLNLRHLLPSSCSSVIFSVVSQTPPFLLFLTLVFLLLPYSLLPLVDPSDCRVKLWSYVPGLTPCLPRRVLAIKGRATSLPWLPLLRSPTLPSSGTLLTNFHLLFPAAFLSPYFYFFTLVVPTLLCLLLFCSYPPFHFCSNSSNILFSCFLLFCLFTCCSVWLLFLKLLSWLRVHLQPTASTKINSFSVTEQVTNTSAQNGFFCHQI